MLVNVDSGHGSETGGKRTPDGYREHWANTKVAGFFADALARHGILYMKTGWNDANAKDDVDTPLSDRQKAIKAAGCDYSFSFHYNAFGDGKTYNSAEGIEALYSNKAPADSKRLADAVQYYLIQGTQQKNRGAKPASLAMCNCSVMGTKAAILIECGFMTNAREAALMQTDAFCQECAEEAMQGFCKYLGIKYIPAESKPVNEAVNAPQAPAEPAKPAAPAKLYRVQVGAFSKKANATALVKKLKAAGFTDAYIV